MPPPSPTRPPYQIIQLWRKENNENVDIPTL